MISLRRQPVSVRTRVVWPRGSVELLFQKKPNGLPNIVWRKLRGLRFFTNVLTVAFVLFALGGILYGLGVLDGVAFVRGVFIGKVLLLYICLALLPWLLLVTMRFKVRRVCSVARALDYKMCTYCGYDLRGLPERHACPECGVEYDLEEVRASWQALIGKQV